MQAFERFIADVMDYNRFDPDPDMQKFIGGFEKRYMSKRAERTPISFDELQGNTSPVRTVTKQSAGELSNERDKGKSR